MPENGVKTDGLTKPNKQQPMPETPAGPMMSIALLFAMAQATQAIYSYIGRGFGLDFAGKLIHILLVGVAGWLFHRYRPKIDWLRSAINHQLIGGGSEVSSCVEQV